MINYQVNNKIFFNTYLAYYEAYKSGQPITFHCYDAEYDRLDWTKEPEQSFEQLMDSHAINLRAKYERLILMWSGGTDSHTIYNVFKRNNIHIDEILIKHTDVIDSYPDNHVDWIMKNCYDPTTKITAINEYDTSIRSLVVHNEDWIFDNSGDLLKFGQSAISNATTELCNRSHNGFNWGVVVGLEKPSLTFNNGSWYTRQSDRVIRQAMGHERFECFFLDPVINLKQSHLAKRALKHLQQSGQDRNWSNASENRNNGAVKYRAWAKVVGRHDELTIGISHLQKQINGGIMNTQLRPESSIEEFDLINGESMLLAQLKNQDPTAINYVKGLYNLRSEQGFYKFLNENCLESPDQIFKTKQIWSKSYNLGT